MEETYLKSNHNDELITNPVILCICVVGFHHERGNELEWYYPQTEPLPEKIRWAIADLATPDRAHLYDRDYCYFAIKAWDRGISTDVGPEQTVPVPSEPVQTVSVPSEPVQSDSVQTVPVQSEPIPITPGEGVSLPDTAPLGLLNYFYGVSCFQQIPAHEANDQKDQITRSMVQKSVVVIATKPLYGAIRFVLDPITQAYFKQGYFNERDMLIGAYHQLNTKFNQMSQEKMTSEARELLFMGVSLRGFIQRYGRNALLLYKLMWLEKKIVFYGFRASEVCDIIVALSSLMPHFLYSLTPNLVRNEKENKEAHDFALPLNIFDHCFLAPYVSLATIDLLMKQPSYIVGSSNMLFTEGAVPADIIVYTEGGLKWINTKLESCTRLPPRDKMFIEHIMAKVKESDESSEKFVGSDAWIRERFRAYTKSLLCTIGHSDPSIGHSDPPIVSDPTGDPHDPFSPGDRTDFPGDRTDLPGDGTDLPGDRTDLPVNLQDPPGSSLDPPPGHNDQPPRVGLSDPPIDRVISDSSVYNMRWVELWKATKNFQKWKECVVPSEMIQSTRPVHIEHDTKTELDEFQEAVTQQAARVGNYLWSFYESTTTTTTTTEMTQPTGSPTTTESASPQKESTDMSQVDDGKVKLDGFNLDTITSFFGWGNITEKEEKVEKTETTVVEETPETKIDSDSNLEMNTTTEDNTTNPTQGKEGVGELLSSYLSGSFLSSFWTK